MVKTASTMLELGTPALPFSLPSTAGETVSLSDFGDSKALLVIFMCNHCPFVKHVADELAKLANDYMPQGVGVVGISSNDVEKYPDDSMEKMKEEAVARGYAFPYLLDESQEVAKAYRAACTPDFYIFDSEMKLAYRGQMDESRPNSGIPVTASDLRTALDAIVAGQAAPEKQIPSIGCNIKWIPGNEPDYFNPSGMG